LIDDAIVLRMERLRDDAEALKAEMRQRIKSATGQITATDLRKKAAAIGERWLADFVPRADIAAALGGTELADRTVHFQRILTYAERATQRSKYDASLGAILKNFRAAVVVPLKARRSASPEPETVAATVKAPSLRAARIVFVGKSFLGIDAKVTVPVERILRALGLVVVTGEKPKADAVSKKVKGRIDSCDVFLGIFTRRDKLEGKDEWATSSWVVDEKAYAIAQNRKLVILREAGVNSIGGIQGDYEYIEFDRTKLEELMVNLVEIFRSDD